MARTDGDRLAAFAGLILAMAAALVVGTDARAAVRYVSHRGEWNDAPEGSAAAYRLAAERGLDLVKMDVQETKDGEIVMSHDDSFLRTAGVEGRIRNMTLAEIREKVVYKACGGFAGERPVTFAEALQIVRNVPEIWIDFKAYNPAFAEKVFRTAAANGFDDSRIMVATYNVCALKWVKLNRPQVRRVMHMNIREPEPGKWTVSFTHDERHASLAAIEQLIYNLKSKYGLYGINTDEDPTRIDADFIRRMHAAGLWVAIWYGNQTKAADYYLDNGCDAIVTACRRKHVRQMETRYLDEFNLDAMSCGLRLRPVKNRSVKGMPLRLGSATNTFARGVGTHVESVLVLEADGRVAAFDATVGIDWAANEYPKAWDTGHNWGGVQFRVYADGEIVADSGIIKPQGGQPKRLHAELTGARTVVLEATDCGDWAGYRFGHADWAEAFFTCQAGAVLKPHSDRSLTRQLGVLTPPEKEAPQINGAPLFGVRPGHVFLYRLPVSGLKPMRYAAAGLPTGVKFDAEKGILSGKVAVAGDYAITFTAENPRGKASKVFVLKVGDTISLTPPMGWNHWNIHASGIRPEHVRAAADGMVKSGLADHGWCYVNIDDGWERKPDADGKDPAIAPPTRNPDGTIRPNDRFADMKGLADYVHSLGLKIGLYSSPGPKTCGGFEGSWGHEEQDAKSYADWGFDYLKHDWCSYGGIFGAETKGRKATTDDYAKPYRKMTAALLKQNRDIIHAFCQYGMGDVQTWGRAAGAQVWRSHGDLKDAWMAVVKAVDSYGDTAWKYTGPGFWCDPDMMVVGYLNTDKGMHDSDLSPNEQYTHVSLWCMLNAPLLLGCDLNRLDVFTRSLLVNDEVLAVHQDALGRTARRMVHDERTDVWTRPLADGSFAVAVVNRFPFAREVRLDFAAAGFKPEKRPNCDCDAENAFAVRDLWRQRDLGVQVNAMTLDLPGHATTMLRLTRK